MPVEIKSHRIQANLVIRHGQEDHALLIVRDEFRPAIPRSGCSPALPPSRPRELHPKPLTDPDVSLSTHPARATH